MHAKIRHERWPQISSSVAWYGWFPSYAATPVLNSNRVVVADLPGIALDAKRMVVKKCKERLQMGHSGSLRALGYRCPCHHPPPLGRQGACHLQLIRQGQRCPQHVALIQDDTQPMDLSTHQKVLHNRQQHARKKLVMINKKIQMV